MFSFVDDFGNYFSQVPVAPEDWWKTVVAAYSRPHLDPHIPPHLKFVAEYRLGFGITVNSNICQRLANFAIHTFIHQFRLSEQRYEHLELQCVQQWLRSRRELAVTTHRYEDTLFRAHIYTDDSLLPLGCS